MEVLLLLCNRGSILKNVPHESVYCVVDRFALPYVLCEDTTSALARPGVSENVTNDTLARNLPEYLYTPCLLSSCVHPVSPTNGSSSPHSSRYWKLLLALKPI